MEGYGVIALSLWDTAGQEDYDQVRALSYSGVDIFLISFSLVSSTSLENVKYKWINEIKTSSPNAVRVLVGTKKDLREDEDYVTQLKAKGLDDIVTFDDGLRASSQLQCHSYHECSALTQEGLNELFDTSIKAALNERRYLLIYLEQLLGLNIIKNVVFYCKLLFINYCNYMFFYY